MYVAFGAQSVGFGLPGPAAPLSATAAICTAPEPPPIAESGTVYVNVFGPVNDIEASPLTAIVAELYTAKLPSARRGEAMAPGSRRYVTFEKLGVPTQPVRAPVDVPAPPVAKMITVPSCVAVAIGAPGAGRFAAEIACANVTEMLSEVAPVVARLVTTCVMSQGVPPPAFASPVASAVDVVTVVGADGAEEFPPHAVTNVKRPSTASRADREAVIMALALRTAA
jgi:hypothetical protein